MTDAKKNIIALLLAFSVLTSLPWLVPGTGFLALVSFVPLLYAERMASDAGVRRFFFWYFAAFILWNAFTTFWVCNATVGGGIFAVVANALQMSAVFALFRAGRRRLPGVLPYIFLAACWVAWERWYLSAEISWPWLLLGNAFARTTSAVQWYCVTGTLGGSLWIWAVNLSLFGLGVSLGDGRFRKWNGKARFAAVFATALISAGPVLLSEAMYVSYREVSESEVDALVGQPNFDPYEKFESIPRAGQDAILIGQFRSGASGKAPDIFVAPETFTSGVNLADIGSGVTYSAFRSFLDTLPNSTILFGASTYDIFNTASRPSILARPFMNGWYEGHNSAIAIDASGRTEVFHKSRLVVGTEKIPYPRVFVPLDERLGYVMGRCVGQDEISVLHLSDGTPFGCAVCYESVYGEYCTGYVKKGAGFLSVITNDAWWGDTPGYRQHLSYSALRAIELRRDIVRCGNTGISAFINQRGDIVSRTSWWERQTLRGTVNTNSKRTFFVRYGDIAGRVCTLAFLLLLALALVGVRRSE